MLFRIWRKSSNIITILILLMTTWLTISIKWTRKDDNYEISEQIDLTNLSFKSNYKYSIIHFEILQLRSD